MNPIAQRVAIAEVCGWLPDDDGAGFNTWEASWVGKKLFGKQPYFNAEGRVSSYTVDRQVPDYLNDLNAMHEAEKCLPTIYEAAEYTTQLESVLSISGNPLWHATAAQRAEAFLRTIGKWVLP